MPIKVIAIDLDGTLLRSNCTISIRTAKAIKQAYEVGIQIIPSTGRSFRNTKKVLEQFPYLEYYLTSNGSVFTHSNENVEILFSEYLCSHGQWDPGN